MEMFGELSLGRAPSFSGPAPLSWSDIAAWSSVTRTPIAPWEARVLRIMDAAFLAVARDAQPADKKG